MKHLREITEIFEKHYNWDKRGMSLLGNFISSMIRSRSVNLQKIAESLEGLATTESNYRRIQKMFQNQDIDYEVTAKLLSSILPQDEKWILTMDRTNWKLGKNNINLLVLGVAYKGMAIPLLWKFLSKDEDGVQVGKQGNSNTKERQEILQRFIDIFGVEKIEILTADREFIGAEWFDWLNEKKIHFLNRIRNNIKIDNGSVEKVDVKKLLIGIEKDDFTVFDKRELFGMELYLGGAIASKSDDELILVSNARMKKNSIETYRKRWEIETMFGAFKSKGFNLEESKLSEDYKIEKLMAFLSIGFMWAILAGDYREKEKPIPYKKKSLIE